MKIWISTALAGLVALIVAVNPAVGEEMSAWANNPSTMTQWVSPAVAGEIPGRVVLPQAEGEAKAVSEANVVLTDQDGESIRVQADENGEFLLTDVAPGMYAMTARGDGAFASYAMHVVEGAASLPRRIDIAAANVDLATIKPVLLRYTPANVRVMTGGQAGVASSGDISSLIRRMTPASGFQVARTEGGLTGRILAPELAGGDFAHAAPSNVFLIFREQLVDRVLSDADGIFRFSDRQPGQYGLLVIGSQGMAIVGFELVDGLTVSTLSQSNTADGETFAAFQPAPAPGPMAQIQVAPLPAGVNGFSTVQPSDDDSPVAALEVDALGNPIGLVDEFGAPIGGGGALGGGGGGGGFGGGGLGGLGALAGLAGLAGLGGGDDDGGNGLFPPQPASPAAP